MRKILILTTVFLFISGKQFAQFINKGEIIFEVKTNIKKTMGNSAWAESMKDKLPNFKTSFYKYQFNNERSQYYFDHWENKESLPEFFRMSDEKISWESDFSNKSISKLIDVFGSEFNIKDSLPVIQWKLTNENRIISGYNCKKAIGRIMDSVYVFAFFTEEIIPSGGPCSINGLPGMILGLTIPRVYTSWMAISVAPLNTDPVFKKISPTSKKTYTYKEAQNTIIEKTKNWGDPNDPDSRKWMDQMIWGMLL